MANRIKTEESGKEMNPLQKIAAQAEGAQPEAAGEAGREVTGVSHLIVELSQVCFQQMETSWFSANAGEDLA